MGLQNNDHVAAPLPNIRLKPIPRIPPINVPAIWFIVFHLHEVKLDIMPEMDPLQYYSLL
jgi:hypothetical protein